MIGRDLCQRGRLIKGTILEDVVEHVCLVHVRSLAVENGKKLQYIDTDLAIFMVKLRIPEVFGCKNFG